MTRSESSDFVAVVVAAGQASRFGDPLPKQFHDLGGISILERSVRAVVSDPDVAGVVVVLPPQDAEGERGTEVRAWPGVLDVVSGGASRAESCRLGVAAAGERPFVLVHDAARPLCSPAVVAAVVQATRETGAAVPALQVPDTVKRADGSGKVAETLDRSLLRLAQTPQGSRTAWLRDALDRAAAESATITDEASALEWAGYPVALVAGEAENFKITGAEDLVRARRLVEGEMGQLRVGSGFDVHRIDEARPLFLGGVRFLEGPGLAGHSDADVVLHAAMDALLGAAGLGDIGAWFPPDDPKFEGAASGDLAREVARRIDEAGWTVVNLDLTLLAERPKIRSRVEEMRESIGACFGLSTPRVGLKATTLERLGSLGRGEGMACQAVALLSRAGDP